MSQKDITSMRGVIEHLKARKEILVTEKEVDPIYEIAGIQKALEDGPALLFENIKGYPGVRNIGNVLGRQDIVAGIFDLDDPKKLKFKALDSMKNPLPPTVVEKAPCQEVVITEDINVMETIPIIKHTALDAGRILGGGVILLHGKWARGGSDLSFKRMHYQGKDWCSVTLGQESHLGEAYFMDHRDEKIPITVNICSPPAICLLAATAFARSVVPQGSDELGFAGAFQGSPVEICKAKTVDAYAIAQAEWVIEGYLTPERVWEIKCCNGWSTAVTMPGMSAMASRRSSRIASRLRFVCGSKEAMT